MIYPVSDVSFSAHREHDARKEIDAEEDFVRKPFSARDNITGNKIYVDPTKVTADDNGYYTVFDPSMKLNFVIDPPKLVVFDPITGKELVIDPRKPVGQFFSAFDPKGNPIAMDTSDQQPYIYEDPVTGARLLKDENRVKPFTVIDPRSGKEVRIDPMLTDGKPYVHMDDEGLAYSVLPVIPGTTPILFENPETGETTVLGGPVMIQDPETKNMKYQEGPFTMRDPKTGQTINQIGPIIIKDPETGGVRLMSNPKYVKHPQTGEMTLEPQILYDIQDNGVMIPVLTQSELEKAKFFQRHQKGAKDMIWDPKLGVFISPATQAKFNEKTKFKELEKSSNEKLLLGDGKIIEEVPSLETLLEGLNMVDVKRIKKFMGTQTVAEQNNIQSIMSKKKQMERTFMRTLLNRKETRQNKFIQNLIHHFGNRLKYYDRVQFKGHIQENIQQENEKVVVQVEEKIRCENNKALDAMLIDLNNQKKKILTECNPIGTVSEFSIGCEGNTAERCDFQNTDSDSYKRAIEVFNHFKTSNLKLFNEALQRENEHIRRELIECLRKELEFVESQVDELYVKVCCQKFLVIT
ncbi:hypothetical protein WDU94_008775 [Cyamophila willieti]